MRVTWSNNTELMRITGDGNVGIGTSSPGYKLDVLGEVRIKNATATKGSTQQTIARFETSEASPVALYIENISSTTSNAQGFHINCKEPGVTNDKVVILQGYGGKVGVGTLTPSYPLQVNGTIYSTSNLFVNNGQTDVPSLGTLGGTGDRLILWGGSAGTYPFSLGMNSYTMWYSVPASGQHQWYINGGVGMTLSNNNLGIGTASPAYTLDVSGTSRFQNTINATYSASFDTTVNNVRNYFTATGSTNTAHVYLSLIHI